MKKMSEMKEKKTAIPESLNEILNHILGELTNINQKLDKNTEDIRILKMGNRSPKKNATEKINPQMILQESDSSDYDNEEEDDNHNKSEEDPEDNDLFLAKSLRDKKSKSAKAPLSLKSRAGFRKIVRNHAAETIYKRLSVGGYEMRKDRVVLDTDKQFEISWKIRSINGYLKFLDEVEHFQLKYQKEITYLFPLLQRAIGEELLVKFPTRYRRNRDLYKADIDDITQVVQSLFCPNDRNHFIRLLKKSCEEFKVEQKDENFLPVKSALTGLKEKFLERFNFLREACQHWGDAEAVPNINFKEGGILNLWMELTRRTTFKVELVNEKFKSMEDLMMKYFVIVDKISVLSEKSKAYHHMVNLTQLKKASFQQRSQRETSTLDDALDEWTQDEDRVEAPREVKGG
jgi:hypothetical protein